MVRVKDVEAHVVLLLRDATVAVNIQHLKYKAIARHYVEFTLGDLAIAVDVKEREACVPLASRDLAITILVQQFERQAADVTELQLSDEAIFVRIYHVKAFFILGLCNLAVTISV